MNANLLSMPFLPAKYVLLRLSSLAWTLAGASALQADYEVYQIRTVEWLVDNSDVIAVVVGGDEEGKGKPESIVHTLKGDASEIVYPLQESWGPGPSDWRPRSRGPARMLFIRGKYELLQTVKLARPVMGMGERNDLHVERTAYGVTQYGDLLLTETNLFDAIDMRLKRGPGQTLMVDKSAKGIGKGGNLLSIHAPDRKGSPRITQRVRSPVIVPAPTDFPFETTYETFMLVVPFTVERRDHFINVSQTRNAGARVRAIRELSYFDDEKAMQAIQEATKCDNATPAFQRSWHASEVKILTSADVRAKAKNVLKAMGQD